VKLKARSRLIPTTLQLPVLGADHHKEQSAFSATKPRLTLATPPAWWVQRQPKLISLIIGLVLYGYLSYILTHIFPSELRDWLIPGGFLPVLGLAALAHVYVGSFVMLNSRRAVLISVGLSWVLWLQLHEFVVDWEVVGISFTVLILIELSFFVQKRV
jgi:hypothetical protein